MLAMAVARLMQSGHVSISGALLSLLMGVAVSVVVRLRGVLIISRSMRRCVRSSFVVKSLVAVQQSHA